MAGISGLTCLKIAMKILSVFLCFIGYMLISSSKWATKKFGEMSYEQFMFHLNTPLEAEVKLIHSYIQNTVMIATIIAIVIYLLANKIKKHKLFIISFSFFICSIIVSWMELNISKIIKEYNTHATFGNFYEKHYVDVNNVKIKAPDSKKNLIMIFAESMEATFANQDYFGDNLIPELTMLAKENISFSHTDGFGGFQKINGARYTQASLISQLCAVPLRLPIDVKRFHPKNGFLPGTICLSDILAKDNYNQSFMIGTTKSYAGTDKFFDTHGKTKILDWDFYYNRDNLPEDEDPKRKRIVRDEKLLKYAKEEIMNLYNKKEAFAFTIMTLDTHFGDEHFDKENCKIKYHSSKVQDEDYFKNVISCSSTKINTFIEWIKSQPFYENTVVVIVGDHPVMGDAVSFNSDADRKVYNVYINPSIKGAINKNNRKFSALDTMPTILDGMGYTIEGGMLGLGVSLFSNNPTLLEQGISVEELNEELDKQSEIYNNILYGKK